MKTTTNDITLVLTLLKNAGINAAEYSDPEHTHTLDLYCFTNNDGSLRWLWPVQSGRVAFLRFYNASSAKAKVFVSVATMAAKLGLARIISHQRLRLYIHQNSSNILASWGRDFAIFTGTPGPNRKGVIATNLYNTPSFIKISLSSASAELIHQEAIWLKKIGQYSLVKMKVPALLSISDRAAAFEDICTPGTFRSNELLPQHYEALAELQDKSTETVNLAENQLWKSGMQKLKLLNSLNDTRIPKGIVRKLNRLAEYLKNIHQLPCCVAHGDFTPWNMYVHKESLNVYDWELAIDNAPLLWDAYHFIIQTGILVEHRPSGFISESLNSFEESQWVKSLVHKYGISSRQQRMLYLLLNTIYYLELYSRQSSWHMQVSWLLQSWSALLSEVMAAEGLLSQRELTSMDMIDYLQGKDYTALKWICPLPEALPVDSDFDLCVTKSVLRDTKQFLEQHPFAGKLLINSKSYMDALTLLLKDGSLLSIDLIHQFKRRSLDMLDTSEVITQRRMLQSGVQVPSSFHQFSYTWLFYILNGAPVPEKYSVHYNEQPPEFYQQFERRWGINLKLEKPHYSKVKHSQVMEQILKQPSNRGWNKIRNIFYDFKDRIGEFFNQKGMVITFSGVDGAGKSTVIENVKTHIDKKMRRKVVVLRHRPSILPILSAWTHGKAAAEQKAANTLPRQGGNKNSLSSLFRFAYYFSDYFFGQFYIQCKYVWRGYIVLYDRYYFDFINDSRRSNIKLSPTFTSLGYKLLLKPDYNFFLYAQPEEILRRKQELDADTIRELTGKYLALFNGLSQQYHHSRYIPILNEELDITLNTIYKEIEKRA